jgi:hypothetical protein
MNGLCYVAMTEKWKCDNIFDAVHFPVFQTTTSPKLVIYFIEWEDDHEESYSTEPFGRAIFESLGPVFETSSTSGLAE